MRISLFNIIAVIALLSPSIVCAGIYKWTDENGKVHFGDDTRQVKADAVESVKVRDKYAVPVAEALESTAFDGNGEPRTVVFNDISLDLPRSAEDDILIGRVVCGRPTDLYWTKGFVRLEREVVGPQWAAQIEESGYFARVGEAVREAGELEVTAKIKHFFMNTCVKRKSRKLSQDSTYIKIEWTLHDPLEGEDVLVFETKGSHAGIHLSPVENGREKSFDAAFDMAVRNMLANAQFAEQLSVQLDLDEAEVAVDKIDLEVDYSGSLRDFEDKAKFLKERTVVVKTKEGHGSGVFIAEGGFVLTNAHVVGDETDFRIRSGAGNFKAELVKKNERRDVALLKIKGGKKAPTPISISKRKAEIGEELYVIGTPLDMQFSHTITRGIVSAKRRMRGMDFLQTDAAINFGNSGGPVFNKNGNLVAITVSSVMSRSGATLNINYLIPIDDALKKLGVEKKLDAKNLLTKVFSSDSESVDISSEIDDVVAEEVEELSNSGAIHRVYDWLNRPVYRF